MLNGISGSLISPIDNPTSISEDSATPQQTPGSQEPEQTNSNSLNPEEEIRNALLALAQELEQMTQLLQVCADELQGNNNSAQDGARGISSNPSGSASPALPQTDIAETTPASAHSASAPSPASHSAGTAAPSGSLGPNVPTALQPFVQAINAASEQTKVPASLIGAQILQESGGNPNAVTTNPALGLPDTGLMQVDQATFQGLQQQYPDLLGGKSVSDPATNIMAGALLDAQLLKQNNGDIGAALTAYNGSADSNYVQEVTAKMNALQNGTPVPGGFS